jgi:hypothetical protein
MDIVMQNYNKEVVSQTPESEAPKPRKFYDVSIEEVYLPEGTREAKVWTSSKFELGRP